MQQIPVAERAGRVGVGRRDRRAARPGEQPGHPLRDGLAVTGQRAAAGAGALAQGEELREDLVGRRDGVPNIRLGAGGVVDRIDDAVEHHRPHPAREQVGVDLADHRSVGQADVGELPVADELAQRIEVAGGVRGGDVRQERPAHLTAAAGQLDRLALVGRRLGRRDRNKHPGPEPVLGGLAGEALHR